jgi:ribose-phosphate pyrophosphokinase
MKLLTGNSNAPLAEAISAYLGLPLTKASVRRFSDDEIFVEIQENVRGEDVFVIQSTSFPANDHLMELLICIDALRRSSARCITAVIPYFGYARQDRKPGPRTPISAKLVANLITTAGANRVLTMDLHAGQIQGFFDIPTDNLYGAPVMSADISERMSGAPITVVSPDVGGVVRARALAKRLNNAPLAIIDKRRERAGESEVMNIIGDVKGRVCIRRRCADERRSDQRFGLCQPWRFVGPSGGAGKSLDNDRIGDNRFDHSNRSGAVLQQNPPPFDCAAHCRSHAPDQRRKFGLQPV